jgi:hypothetical protein
MNSQAKKTSNVSPLKKRVFVNVVEKRFGKTLLSAHHVALG